MALYRLCFTIMSKKSDKTKQDAFKHIPIIKNKKARFNYQILEKLETGIVLRGTEVKSLRAGKASLEEAFCRIRNGELFLIGCTIQLYEHGNLMNHEPTRTRKLLIHKRELKKLEVKVLQKGLTIVPTRIYFTRGIAKVEIATARGKTTGDKREKMKERDINRDIQRQMKRGNW